MEALGRQQRGLPFWDKVLLGFALGLMAIQSLSQNEPAVGVDPRSFDAGAAALLAVAVGLILLGRRAPATGALGNLAVTLVWYALGYRSGLVNVPFLASLYLVGATGDRRRQLLVGGIAVLLSGFTMLVPGDESVTSTAGAVGWTLAGILFGELAHNRRALLAEYRERAVRAEAERDAEAERRVANARLEMARDLHDVLAHTVSVMTVQAGVAQDALSRGSDGTAAALGTIRAAGREAMDEVQALVAVLRNGSDPAGTAPAPRLDRLGDLVTATTNAGVDVKLVVDVPAGAGSEVAELTAYRVVQESLTNVVRHAEAGTATVAVRAEGGDLVVDVCDDGAAAPADHAAGFGLRGMRERVEASGGHIRAGPQPSGGWRVTARIPLDRRRDR